MKPPFSLLTFVLGLLLTASCQTKPGKKPHGMLTDTPVDTTTEVLLPDASGQQRSIEQFRGNTVIMDVLLETPSADDRHIARLRSIYNRYHSEGLEIYQICLDTMPDRWRSYAKTLPWIAVYDDKTLQSALLEKYRVLTIPSTQIFNPDGTRTSKTLNDFPIQ